MMIADSGALAPSTVNAGAKWIKTTEDVEELSEMDKPRRHSLTTRVYAVHLGKRQLLSIRFTGLAGKNFTRPARSSASASV